jgi:hypothetical protein
MRREFGGDRGLLASNSLLHLALVGRLVELHEGFSDPYKWSVRALIGGSYLKSRRVARTSCSIIDQR